MKHIIKLFLPVFILLVTFASCDTDKEWIYVEPDPVPGVELSGSAVAISTEFQEGDVEGEIKKGLQTTYIWLKAGDIFLKETSLDGVETKYGMGAKVGDFTHSLVADANAFKIEEAGLYFFVYNAGMKQLTLLPAKFGVIGDATPGAWASETVFPKVVFDEGAKRVTFTGAFELKKGEIKFRFHDWTIEVAKSETEKYKMHTNQGTIDAGVKLGEKTETLKGGGENMKVESGAVYEVTLELNLETGVFTTQAKKGDIIEPEYPENLYMIGQDFGAWNWGDKGVVKMIPVREKEGAFWTIKYFTKNNGFKWSPIEDWPGSFAGLLHNTGIEEKDGNAIVKEDGLYMVYIDMKEDKLVLEKPLVYGTGDAFGGFNDATYPFVIEDKSMTITTTVEGNLRMYATSSLAAGHGWWNTEFNIYDGKIVYRGEGGDQDAVPVKAGAKITLDFSTDTGSIK